MRRSVWGRCTTCTGRVVLAHERRDHLADRVLLGVLREEALVAEVAAVAHHHQVHTGDPALAHARDRVRVERLRRVGVLPLLDARERRDLVAVHRRLFELEPLRGGLHALDQGLHDVVLAALEEELRVADVLRIRLGRDVADTGRGAAPDLMEQARPRPVAERRVLARAQTEDLLQELDRLTHRPCARIGAKVGVLAVERAAMEAEPGKVAAGDHQVRVGLVVAEDDVVARRERLDEVVLEDQRFGLGARDGDLEVGHLRHHHGDARPMVVLGEVRRDALPEIACLPDVKHVAARAEHAIHPRPVRQAGNQRRGIEGALGRGARIARRRRGRLLGHRERKWTMSANTASNIASVRRRVWVLYRLQW